MAHPARYLIRFLSLSETLSLKEMNSSLALHGLAVATQEEVDAEVAALRNPPEDLRTYAPHHKPSRAWLKKMRIFSLFHPDAGTREMKTAILEQPRIREKVDTLILGNVQPAEIAYRLQKIGVRLGVVAIAEYRHYFWNTEHMGLSDWATYFHRDREEDSSGRTAATQEVLQSVLLGGPDLAKYRVGVHQEVDTRKLIQDLLLELQGTFYEVRALPLSTHKVEMLAILTRGIVRLDERLSQGEQALQDVLKRFEKFKVIGDDAKLPSLAQLAPTGSVSSRSRREITATREPV